MVDEFQCIGSTIARYGRVSMEGLPKLVELLVLEGNLSQGFEHVNKKPNT